MVLSGLLLHLVTWGHSTKISSSCVCVHESWLKSLFSRKATCFEILKNLLKHNPFTKSSPSKSNGRHGTNIVQSTSTKKLNWGREASPLSTTLCHVVQILLRSSAPQSTMYIYTAVLYILAELGIVHFPQFPRLSVWTSGGNSSSSREIYERAVYDRCCVEQCEQHLLFFSFSRSFALVYSILLPTYTIIHNRRLKCPCPYYVFLLFSENNSSSPECPTMGSYGDNDALIYEPSLGIVVLLSICYGVISLGAVVGK